MKIDSHPDVPASVAKLITGYAERLSAVSADDPEILVMVVPSVVVEGPDGGCGWGLFAARDGKPVIYLPGFRADEITDREWRRSMLPQVLAHEWAHYEQWTRGKPVQERGVKVRARNLLRLAKIRVP